MRKYKKYAGADRSTPGIPQYFSWINNTNEGSTERQTLINLDFFRFMKEKYGMQIRIYAWDAGNFDGAAEGYGDTDSVKFRSQYPDGYKNIVAKAASLGIQMGLWGSPDGFGDDEKTEKERFDFFVHLCRDYNFGLFKLDGVCGRLRAEKAGVFAEMMRQCRKYVPGLIVLNHRLELFEAEKYVTTFLWKGDESYTDVFLHNTVTAPHGRAYLFSRGHVDGLNRLAEDHGVCLSSSLDYFEDELVYQAFSRNLILSPEIYGNPWFLKDSELPRLARIYNISRRNADILVNGMLLPEGFGANAVSRGDGSRRFICTGNDTWEPSTVLLPVDERIGLDAPGKYDVIIRHPYEEYRGSFEYGSTAKIVLAPFRAVLIEVTTPDRADPVLVGCKYETLIEEPDGTPEEVRYIKTSGGEVVLRVRGEETLFAQTAPTDEEEKTPVKLGTLDELTISPEDGEKLYEACMFAVDNDSLEARCIKRSGQTSIPEVRAAREAFFNQLTYKLRGCEAKNLFDGRDDTFFDAQTRTYCGGMRLDGGCLRVDAGETIDADRVEITCFAADHPTAEVRNQTIPVCAESSEDLGCWKGATLVKISDEGDESAQVVKFGVHSVYELPGRKMTAVYGLSGPVRYIRIAEPMDRIFSVRFFKGAKEISLKDPKANNMMAHYSRKPTRFVKSCRISLPDFRSGSYISLAVNGEHGAEGVYCCLEQSGELIGFPGRAPDWRANVWEHRVCTEGTNNTFYFPLDDGMRGQSVTLYAVFNSSRPEDTDCVAWLCDAHK